MHAAMNEVGGSHTCYSMGCREPVCVEAHREYERERSRVRRRPDSNWRSPFVSPAVRREVIAHLHRLQARGVGYRRMNKVTGIPPRTLSKIGQGQTQRITRRVAEQILALHYDRIPKKRSSAEGRRQKQMEREGVAA